MATFDSVTSGPLLRQFEAANEAEGLAIRELRAAQESGADRATLMELTNRMTEAQNNKMGIWQQLQSSRL